MPQRTIAVGSSVGLHARPASLLVAAAGKAVAGGSASSVTIAKDGAEGDQAETVLDELAAIVAAEED